MARIADRARAAPCGKRLDTNNTVPPETRADPGCSFEA
jgi:hypothetical protein